MIKHLLSRRKDREGGRERAVGGGAGRRFKRYKKQVCYDFVLL